MKNKLLIAISVGCFLLAASPAAKAEDKVQLSIDLMPVTCVVRGDLRDCDGPVETKPPISIVLNEPHEGKSMSEWTGQYVEKFRSDAGIYILQLTAHKRFHKVFKATSYAVDIAVYDEAAPSETRVELNLETSHPSVSSTFAQLNYGKLHGVVTKKGDREYYPMVLIMPSKAE